jgi:hypothetical protein
MRTSAGEHGMAQRNGTGLFPREVMNRFPPLPLEEEGRLNDMPLRESFFDRVFHSPERSEGAYCRWTEMLDEYKAGSPRNHGRRNQRSARFSGSLSCADHRDSLSLFEEGTERNQRRLARSAREWYNPR